MNTTLVPPYIIIYTYPCYVDEVENEDDDNSHNDEDDNVILLCATFPTP